MMSSEARESARSIFAYGRRQPRQPAAGADYRSLDIQDPEGRKDKRDRSVGLDMSFAEALERFIGVDPTELTDNVKLKRKEPPPKRGPSVAAKPDPKG